MAFPLQPKSPTLTQPSRSGAEELSQICQKSCVAPAKKPRQSSALLPGAQTVKALHYKDLMKLVDLDQFRLIAAILIPDLMSQLCIAAMDGHTARVRELLANISSPPSDSAEALVRAAARGHYSIVEALLEAQASPNLVLPHGGALHCATLNNHLDVVRSLLQGNAAVDLRDNCTYGRGWTALMYAASLGHMAISHLLLSYGAGVNESDRDGQTPLIIAANAGHTAMVLLLIEAGADTSGQDHYGNTALSYARNAKTVSDELVMDRLL